MRLQFTADLPREDVLIGIVVADGVRAGPAGSALSGAIDACIDERRTPLDVAGEARRAACRDILRNGSYKPTGRAKPASEYLLRTAVEGSFPRINALVDANNLVSLRHLVPISIWDVQLAASKRFEFRLAAPGERYVFNVAGQELQLHDLLCGYAWHGSEGRWDPIVNPVKDCLRTKTTDQTTMVAGAVYCPRSSFTPAQVEAASAELRDWLVASDPDARGVSAVLEVGASLEVELPNR